MCQLIKNVKTSLTCTPEERLLIPHLLPIAVARKEKLSGSQPRKQRCSWLTRDQSAKALLTVVYRREQLLLFIVYSITWPFAQRLIYMPLCFALAAERAILLRYLRFGLIDTSGECFT